MDSVDRCGSAPGTALLNRADRGNRCCLDVLPNLRTQSTCCSNRGQYRRYLGVGVVRVAVSIGVREPVGVRVGVAGVPRVGVASGVRRGSTVGVRVALGDRVGTGERVALAVIDAVTVTLGLGDGSNGRHRA